jgi:hypothetical protein
MDASAEAGERGRWRWWPVGLAAALVFGAVLRLAWLQDAEYKRDEAWTFERTQNVGRTEPFPWLGMANSIQVRHPGMSIWVFLLLAKAFATHTAVDLTWACAAVNVAAIGLLVVFALRAVPAGEREPWLWAAALVSLNPLAVLFHRKIWPPSILPIFCIALLASWWYRDRRGAAFAWGLAGLVLGQVHPAGLLFATTLAGWALLFDRRRVAWRWWLAGSLLGALPMLPWVYHVWAGSPGGPEHYRELGHALESRYWTRWALEPFGISLAYTLKQDFGDFLRYPLVGGRPTYLVGVLHAVLLAAALLVLARGARALWRQRSRWRALWVGRDSPTAFTQNAALWGFGLACTASCLPLHRHYMIVTFPLMFVWVARLAVGPGASAGRGLAVGRALLVVLCVSQALISAGFLDYVHSNPRRIGGDYGVPYTAQTYHGPMCPTP